MRIQQIIACLSIFGIYQLYALTADEIIKMIDAGEQQIKDNNTQMTSLQASLKSSLNNVNSVGNKIDNYIKQKQQSQKEINNIKTSIKTEQDKIFKTIKDVPTLPAVVGTALKPFEESYNTTMKKVDDMLDSLGHMLDVAANGMKNIKVDLDKSINTTIPTIIQKGNETTSKLEELKQRAPAIASYVTGVSQQIK